MKTRSNKNNGDNGDNNDDDVSIDASIDADNTSFDGFDDDDDYDDDFVDARDELNRLQFDISDLLQKIKDSECDTDDECTFMGLPPKRQKQIHNPLDIKDKYAKLCAEKDAILKQSKKRKFDDSKLKVINKNIKDFIKTERNNNTDKFMQLLSGDNADDIETYFKTKLPYTEQNEIIRSLETLNPQLIAQTVPLSIQILHSNIPPNYKQIALKYTYQYENCEDPYSSEMIKLHQWIKTFMSIPFGIYANLPIKITDGQLACEAFMKSSMDILNECIYGMYDTKIQILQMIAKWITNPASIGKSIALYGPAGVGKTSIVRNGISRIFSRYFGFISLGGVHDSSTLIGHSSTYIGAKHGSILQTVIAAKHMNPVIFFDELDKISLTEQGQEIAGVLMHLTDSTQNTAFQDNYFSEFEFDLSKSLIFFSYNDKSRVNPILLDRLHNIYVKGYSVKEKIAIANKHLIPAICADLGFDQSSVILTDAVLENAIALFIEKEEGVRNLKRYLENVYLKLNMRKFVDVKDGILSTSESKLAISYPLTMTAAILQSLNETRFEPETWKAMYT